MCFVLSHEKRLLARCTRYPPFCGAEPKRIRRLEEASTHSTLTDIKRPQAIAVFCKYLVYQESPHRSVSRDTLCLMTPLTAVEDESMPVWDVGRRARTDGRGDSICLARQK